MLFHVANFRNQCLLLLSSYSELLKELNLSVGHTSLDAILVLARVLVHYCIIILLYYSILLGFTIKNGLTISDTG